jgi:hypothetical protein
MIIRRSWQRKITESTQSTTKTVLAMLELDETLAFPDSVTSLIAVPFVRAAIACLAKATALGSLTGAEV